MRPFQDQVVVVTGAGSGIGRACAGAFAASGATVHVVDRLADRVEETCGELTGRGLRAVGHVVDCSDAPAVERLAQDVHAREGRIDVLQNGVGILVAGPVQDIPLSGWEAVMKANLWSVVHGVRAFLPLMLQQEPRAGRRGHIVNIASFAGLMAFPFTVPYSTSKFAVVGLSESLSLEVHGRGIGVTMVCPGAVRTRLMQDGQLQLPRSWMQQVVQQGFDRFATSPDDIARAVLRAVRRGDPLAVPSLWLSQYWLLKRLSDGPFRKSARWIYGLMNQG